MRAFEVCYSLFDQCLIRKQYTRSLSSDEVSLRVEESLSFSDARHRSGVAARDAEDLSQGEQTVSLPVDGIRPTDPLDGVACQLLGFGNGALPREDLGLNRLPGNGSIEVVGAGGVSSQPGPALGFVVALLFIDGGAQLSGTGCE